MVIQMKCKNPWLKCIVPEYQCVIKCNTIRTKSKLNNITHTYNSNKEKKTMADRNQGQDLMTKLRLKMVTDMCNGCQLNFLNEDLMGLIDLHQQYESPSEEDLKKITAFPLGDSVEDSEKRFKHVTEIIDLNFQLLVEFSKRVPGFDTITKIDQDTLLEVGLCEVSLLRAARKYDMKTDSLVFANQSYTREDYRRSSMGEAANLIFDFCRTMSTLDVDVAEYALLTTIIIFTKRPFLLEPQKVKKMQDIYLGTLKSYIAMIRPSSKNYFDKLLFMLSKVHILGSMETEVHFFIRCAAGDFPIRRRKISI